MSNEVSIRHEPCKVVSVLLRQRCALARKFVTKMSVRVYVSSRQSELRELRIELWRALSSYPETVPVMAEYFFPWQGRVANGLALCLAELSTCDLFVGVYQQLYGPFSPGHDKSPIHLEYLEARETPRLSGRILLFAYDGIGKRDERLGRFLRWVTNETKIHWALEWHPEQILRAVGEAS